MIRLKDFFCYLLSIPKIKNSSIVSPGGGGGPPQLGQQAAHGGLGQPAHGPCDIDTKLINTNKIEAIICLF